MSLVCSLRPVCCLVDTALRLHIARALRSGLTPPLRLAGHIAIPWVYVPLYTSGVHFLLQATGQIRQDGRRAVACGTVAGHKHGLAASSNSAEINSNLVTSL